MNKNREFEIRLYNIDEKKIKKILKENNAVLINKKRVMPLIAYHHPKGKRDSYIRVRDEGKQITMTVKTKLRSQYPIEREVVIDSFEEGDAILKFLGCKKKYLVEKIRETYQLKGCKEIVFDSYGGIRTYMEIDCHNEKSLKKIANLLGYKLEDHNKKGLTDIYFETYGIKRNRKKGELTFKNAKKILGPLITKNKKLFTEILKNQLKDS